MPEERSLLKLVESLENSFEDILGIIKSMGNEKRLRILISLLTGERSFIDLKTETELKKTALSNHLTLLINSNLIEKPSMGKYKITHDGELFIRVIENSFKSSNIWEKKEMEALQRRQFSDSFVNSFFGEI